MPSLPVLRHFTDHHSSVCDDLSAIREFFNGLLGFYDQFAANNAAGEVVDVATAKVYRRMGDIRARLGQYQQAALAYRRALTIDSDLHQPTSTEDDVVLFRVGTFNALGKARLRNGEFQPAIEAHRQALKELDAVTPELANQQRLRYQRALTLNDLVLAKSTGFVHQLTRRGPRRPGQETRPATPPGIHDEFQRARDLLTKLVHNDAENTDYRLALARCHRGILPVAWANHDDDLARTAKQQAIAILRDLANRKPEDPAIQFELADTLAMTGQTDSRTPLSEADVVGLTQSILITKQLHERFPTAPEFAVLAANSHHQLGSHFLATQAWSDSQQHLTQSASLLERLVASSPTNPLFQVSLARARWELADSLRRQGSLQPSRQVLEEAIKDYDSFRNSQAGQRTSLGLLVGLHRQLARTLDQLGEKRLADEATRTADRLRPSSP